MIMSHSPFDNLIYLQMDWITNFKSVINHNLTHQYYVINPKNESLPSPNRYKYIDGFVRKRFT